MGPCRSPLLHELSSFLGHGFPPTGDSFFLLLLF